MKEDFRFKSAGEDIIGNLFLPDQSQPAGIVITTGPLTSVKEQSTGTYAKALAERGFAALAFDHRCFGESSGEPRQFENPKLRIEDIQNAATALLKDDYLAGLPVYGLGICYGAGPMTMAVHQDSRFNAFAGVAGVYTDVEHTKATMGQAYQKTISRAKEAERVWRKTSHAETIPAVGQDGDDVAMPLREPYEFYGTPRGAVPNYVNSFAVQSYAYTLPFDVMEIAPKMQKPVLIVHSEKAMLPALAHRFFSALKAPKEELWLESIGQIDFYDDPKLIAPSAAAAASWFSKSRTELGDTNFG
jgi:fermentation-respiration switch protein FrsA (DUF1100 family)